MELMNPEIIQDLKENEEPEKKAPVENKKPMAKISIKIIVIALIVIAIGGLAFYFKGLFIAATVNGSPIGRLSVIKELEKSGGKSVLDSLITEKVINDEARKKGIKITDEEITAEIKTIEEQLKSQNATLDQALMAQGITIEYLKKQISIQKKLEKLLEDKIQVTDEEITKYIADGKLTIPEGKEAEYRNTIKSQLRQQKFSTEATTFVDNLKSQAKIQYFVNY